MEEKSANMRFHSNRENMGILCGKKEGCHDVLISSLAYLLLLLLAKSLRPIAPPKFVVCCA